MHCAIVEDYLPHAEYLRGLIQEDCAEHGDPVDFSLFADGESFLESFRPGLYTIVFLDIVMGDLSGFETAQKLRETDPKLPIVFITSERDYALDCYRVHPMDFLLKPVKKEELSWCLNTLRESFAPPACLELTERLDGGSSRSCHVVLDDILYCESIRHGCLLHTPDRDIPLRHTLSEITALLPQNGRYFQCSQGILVNFSQIENFLNTGEIILKDGSSIFCSRRKLKETKTAFADYVFSKMRADRLH